QQRPRGLIPAHHRVLRAGPREDESRVEGLAAQRVVAGTVRTAGDECQFRHHAVGDRVHELRAGPHDAVLLGLLPHHEAVTVLDEQERHAQLITVHYEPCGLVRGVDIDHTTELNRAFRRLYALLLICHNPDALAAELPPPAHERLAVIRLVFVERRVIE